ncbi:unnamed protein product [Diamesa tonsa]
MYHRIFNRSLQTTLAHQRRKFSSRDLKQLSSIVDIKPEIYDALMSKRAVVALESTIITHGMPYPHNIETAIKVESIVRNEGAIPATIAIIGGRIKIGLSNKELEFMADVEGKKETTLKTSRRDMAYVLSKKLNGGTTVAGTLICANMVGIKVFATGGIGGVHRDGENTMDVSADLVEMGKSSVAVISSGVKSILDIPKTLEYLETQGVFVGTYQCPNNDFPAFYTRTSGVKAPYNFENPQEAAAAIHQSYMIGLNSGMLIGVPVPEEFAMDDTIIRESIDGALKEANTAGIKGKEVTPFILAAVSKITAGKSLQTNMALIQNNAKVAAQIAMALSNIERNVKKDGSSEKKKTTTSVAAPVVIGGSIMDVHYSVLDDHLKAVGVIYKVNNNSEER